MGVSKEIENRIFNAFFTTTDPSQNDLSAKGTGLGLKIVDDIAESYGGNVIVSEQSADYNACFKFSILLNSTEG